MTTLPEDIPKISASNTKKQMLDAYNKLVKMLEAQAKQELKPQKTKEELEQKEVIQAADGLTPEKVVAEINRLKMELNKGLTDIAARLEDETTRYLKIKKAIAVKEKELKEIFEIEKSAHALAALLEAQKQQRLEFEQGMAARRKALEDEIAQTKAQWEKQRKEFSEQLKEQKEREEKKRRREKEEYEYALKREREQKVNALQDELRKLEKDIAEKKEDFDRHVKEKESELQEREQAITEREETMKMLEAKLETFPQELDKQVKKAVQEVTVKLKAEAARNEQLLKKEFEGEKNVLLAKIASLEDIVLNQRKQIEKLTEQVETSYAKVQDIAVKAVASAGRRSMVGTPVATVGEDRE